MNNEKPNLEATNSLHINRDRSNFSTAIPNTIIDDPKLSCKAKAVACYFLSRPENWTFRWEEVLSHFSDGITVLRSGMKELVENGYATMQRIRENGKMGSVVYTIHHTTYGKTTCGKTTCGKTTCGKTTYGKTTCGKTTYGKTTCGKTTCGKTTYGKTTYGNPACISIEDNKYNDNKYNDNKNNDKENPTKESREQEFAVGVSQNNFDSVPDVLENATTLVDEQDVEGEQNFATWWEVYPHHRRVDKKSCQRKFLRLSKFEQKLVIRHTEAMKRQEQWLKDSGRFIPLSTTYLNQERYETEIPPEKNAMSTREEFLKNLKLNYLNPNQE